jgi:hypothetical protein
MHLLWPTDDGGVVVKLSAEQAVAASRSVRARDPGDALALLFSRGELPARIECVKAFGRVSSVRPGQRWVWDDEAGTYEPVNGSKWHLMAHEVRRNLGTVYAAWS